MRTSLMGNERGFGLTFYLIVAGVALAALAGFIVWHASVHYDRGYLAKAAEVAEDNRRAEIFERAERRKAEALARENRAQLDQANWAAAHYYDQWEKEKRNGERNSTPLAQTTCPEAPAPGSTVALRSDARINLTWHFVGLWDSAWTSKSGESVFGHPAAIPPAGSSPAARSAYSLEDIRDNHKANAERQSLCERELNGLIDQVESLREQWDRARAAGIP